MFLESKTQIDKLKEFESFNKMISEEPPKKWKKVAIIAMTLFMILLFLPWTQNIQSDGLISALSPNQRPQDINSAIAGRIVKWHIQEGQMVKKGDTLLQISEIKEEYLDADLIKRMGQQIVAKSQSVDFYKQKANTTTLQENALLQAMGLKISQLKNKLKQYNLQVQSDSISFTAAKNQFKIAIVQLERQKYLYDRGLKTLVEFEQRQQFFQDAEAKKMGTENKYYVSKNELLNISLDLLATKQEYTEKISKIGGDRFTALSQVATTEGEIAKLQNQTSNYKERQNFYVITAPQSGQVIKTIKSGLGETVKEGSQLMQIVPTQFDAAVEMYISPNDMPLINVNQSVMLQFDGFPAIIFSGWPQASFGTFGGKISAIDPSINENGKFRIWIVNDGEKPWPTQLKFGAGTKGIALLKDVPIFYELWRQINGFPPEYYTVKTKSTKKEKDEK